MDNDLYIELLESEILRIRRGADDEIQDLKLENDRLKQREEKMLRVIRSIACDHGFCEQCLFYKAGEIPCADAEDDYKVCVNLLNELEAL